MKFSLKLVLCAGIITVTLFSAGGYLMVRQNFDYALADAARQNSYRHTLERYALESEMRNTLLGSKPITDESIREYGGSISRYVGEQARQLGVYDADGGVIFSSIVPALSGGDISRALSAKDGQYVLKAAGNKSYMLLCSALDMRTRKFTVLNVYDVTPVFAERGRQLRSLLLLDSLVVLLSAAALSALSLYLTNPIKKLSAASRKIAQGAYHERIAVSSTDELGELGKSFNQMAGAVEQHVEQLSLSVRQRDDFVAGFSHELKTPMTAIIGYADMLRSSCVDEETQRTYAGHIYAQAKRLERLSHRMMDLMALSDQPVSFTSVEMLPLFDRLKRQLAQELPQVPFVFDAEAGEVLADEVLLECLLRNLIQNAVKACDNGGEIRVTGRVTGNHYQVTVLDHGRGIPKDELGRITEPFYMVDKSRSRAAGGSGLGLAICQRIALLHGGELSFESELSKGTVVSFALIRKEAAHEEL